MWAMRDAAEEEYLNALSAKTLVLRAYLLRGLEYAGPLSQEQERRYVILRRHFSRRLSDEAVRRWGASRLEGDIAAEAAVSSLNGVLRRLGRLTSLEDLLEEETD